MLKYAAGRPLAQSRGSEARRSAIKCFLICSAGPHGSCGDLRIFDDLTKVPQVSDFFTACWTVLGESAADAR